MLDFALFRRYFLALSLLSILSLCAYFNTFSNSFHYDDSFVVGQNSRSIGDFIDLHSYNNWVEVLLDLTNRSILKHIFAANFYFSRDAVFGYHIVNTTVHILVSIVFFSLFQVLLGSSSDFLERKRRFSFALAAAVCFAINPMATEGVTYIMGRSSSLATLFYLLSVFFFFVGYQRAFPGSVLFFFGAFFFFVFGLGTKEILITAPVAAILSLYIFPANSRRETQKKIIISLFLPLSLAGGYIFFRGGITIPDTALESFKMGGSANPHIRYLITQLNVIPYNYLRLLLFPFNQNLDPDISRSIPFLSLSSLLGVAIILFFIIGAFFGKKFAVYSFAVLWFFIVLIPTSTIVPLSDPATEHRAYLPSIGFFMALVLWLGAIRMKGNWKYLLVLIPLLFSTITMARNRAWTNGFTLWSDAALKSPNKSRPFNNLGGVFFREKKDFQGAILQYQKALQLDPRDMNLHKNLAAAYYEAGRLDEAIKKLEHVYFLDPESRSWACSFLGDSYLQRGEAKRAADYFLETIRLGYKEAYNYLKLGNAYKMLGDFEKAKDAYNAGLILEPSNYQLKFHMADIYMLEEEFEKSGKLYLEALRLHPDFDEAMLNLGICYRKMGEFESSFLWLKKAMDRDPNSEKVHTHLGLLYKEMGKFDLSLEELQHALRLNPLNRETLNLIGSVYFSKSDYTNAKEAFRKALEVSPDFSEARHNLKAAEMAEESGAVELQSK